MSPYYIYIYNLSSEAVHLSPAKTFPNSFPNHQFSEAWPWLGASSSQQQRCSCCWSSMWQPTRITGSCGGRRWRTSHQIAIGVALIPAWPSMHGGGLGPCKRHGATSPGASTTRPQPADGVSPSYLLQNYVYFVDEHT